MQTLLELNLGYVTCDIDGEGYNTMWVWHDEWAPRDTPYRVTRNSKCYGNIDLAGQSKQQVIEFLESNSFLVSTRRARKEYNTFMRDFKRGQYSDERIVAGNAAAAPVPRPTVDEELDDLFGIEFPEPSGPCTCDDCVDARRPMNIAQYNVTILPSSTNWTMLPVTTATWNGTVS